MCAWCQREGRPSVLREVEPLDRADVSHGICESHGSTLRAEIKERTGVPTPSHASGGAEQKQTGSAGCGATLEVMALAPCRECGREISTSKRGG